MGAWLGIAVYRHRARNLRQRGAKHGKIGIGRAANEDFVDPAARDVEEYSIRPGIRIRIEDRLSQRSRPAVVRVDNGEISPARRRDDEQEQSCNDYGRSNHLRGFRAVTVECHICHSSASESRRLTLRLPRTSDRNAAEQTERS